MPVKASSHRLHLPSPLTARPKPSRSTLNFRGNRTPSTTVCMSLRDDGPTVVVVWVTGAVGQEFLQVLSDRDFPYRSIKMLASRRSAGKKFTFEDHEYTIEELKPESFDGVDIALFTAGGFISREMGPIAVEKGAVVVDTSSAFRMDPNVPLIIPEVNAEAMGHIKLTGR